MIKWVRIVGCIEGVSALVLYFVAMPMKYFWHSIDKESYYAVGMTHGVLFTIYALVVTFATVTGRLTWRWWGILAVASILPFGPFWADRRLKQVKPDAMANSGNL